ncbi:hypothetical protein [Bacillus sp. CHD6a]|uniref:hypothetical protein n=1 Tax=Bacillus sp. CHD6a TaxID=1643452 RepID=UPI0006CDF791|nr:hypothetical protein [Bacillus sp. CHD6a]KPB03071.1 hypothetical protein AAV98_19215 [Bacillus sp. CHD6a]
MREVFAPVLAEKLEKLAVSKFDEYLENEINRSAMVEIQWDKAEELYKEVDFHLEDERIKQKLFELRDQISNVSAFESQDAFVAGFLQGMLYLEEINAVQESIKKARTAGTVRA